MTANNGTATKEEAQAAVEAHAVPEASAALLRSLVSAKRQAERDFDLVHNATCAALGLDPVEWRAVSVGDDGTVTLGKAG